MHVKPSGGGRITNVGATTRHVSFRPFRRGFFKRQVTSTRAMNGAGAEDERVRVENMWTAEELDALHDPILVPAKLLVPIQQAAEGRRGSLGSKAEEALQRAKDVFDNYLANAEYAPPLADLIGYNVEGYKRAAGEGFSLYGLNQHPPSPKELTDMRQQRGRNAQWPQYDSFTRTLVTGKYFKNEAFYPLIDFHLTADASKLFAKHVSIWPGCFTRYRGGYEVFDKSKLTDAERAARGLPDKVTPTDVVVSREGYIAHRTGNVTEPTPSQKEYMDLYASKIALGMPRKGSPGHLKKPQYVEYLRHNRVEFEAQKGISGHLRAAKRKFDLDGTKNVWFHSDGRRTDVNLYSDYPT